MLFSPQGKKILTHHQWATARDEGKQVDVVLDFSKAFDKVNQSVLLPKLCNFGITGSLLHGAKVT